MFFVVSNIIYEQKNSGCEPNLLAAAVRSLLEPRGGCPTPAGMASPRTLVSGRSLVFGCRALMDRQESRRGEERQRKRVEEDGGTGVLDPERWADGGLYAPYCFELVVYKSYFFLANEQYFFFIPNQPTVLDRYICCCQQETLLVPKCIASCAELGAVGRK